MDKITDVIYAIAKEKDIPVETLFESIQAALVTAYRKNFGKNRQVRVDINRETGEIKVFSRYNVVEEVEDIELEISLEEAKELDPIYEIDDVVEKEETPKDFGRVSALAAKQVVVQRIREAERSSVYDEYKQREQELIYSQIQRINNGVIYFNLGKAEAMMPPKEQIPGERYRVGDRMRSFIIEVKDEKRLSLEAGKLPRDVKGKKGLEIILSRTHPGLVRRLFELEIPEILEGDVLIKSIAREAGSRTKIAVQASREGLDPVGACVGPKGNRVAHIVDELGGEKIDIIEYTDDLSKFIENSLSPAKVSKVRIRGERSAEVVVPDFQLSLAIGKEGQNARLAAKLTGIRIDILSESQDLEKRGYENA
ncbi:MAG: transcription termination/antitermination protein NusA [Tissierellia bacterium]|nr:transcription termination/antitermination protein NusA [Tissierellia bacterium]